MLVGWRVGSESRGWEGEGWHLSGGVMNRA